MITRGTTPTITLTIKNGEEILDLSDYPKVEFYLSEDRSDLERESDKGHLLTLDKSRMTFISEDHTIKMYLSQEETLQFKAPTLYYQLRAKDENDKVLITSIQSISNEKILKGDVI